MPEMKIEDKYRINKGTLDRINELKKLIGEEKFEQILQGVLMLEIPFDEDKFVKLMSICLDKEPDFKYKNIPYQDAEEIISFFCKPFAGRSLRQAKYMLDGMSSLLQNLDEKTIQMMMGSIFSRKQNISSTDVSNLQTEMQKEAKEYTDLQPQHDTPN